LTDFEFTFNSKKSEKMATINECEKLTVQERLKRYFSEDFKRKKVGEIDRNLTTISEISREYQVSTLV